MNKIVWRVFAYLVLAALLTQVLAFEARELPPERVYAESGYTEWLQSLLLLTVAGLLTLEARHSGTLRQLVTCMALMFTVLLIRENDGLLDVWLFHGAWKYLALAPGLYGLWYFWKHRNAVSAQLRSYALTASFGIMVGGFMVMVFSRLFGRAAYWTAILGENYVRVAKNTAEEGTELLALGIILVAVIELRLQSRV